MFHQADIEKKGSLDETETVELVTKLNRRLTINRVRQKIVEMDQQKVEVSRGKVDCKEFIEIYKELSTRPEIYFLLIRFANKDFLMAEDLQLFLEGEQGMTGLTVDRCREIISMYEPSEDAKKCGQLHIDGFNQYLLSEECDIFDEKHKNVCEDMTQPLSHYFISTSHNTYLLRDQLKGPSSTEGYVTALMKGCRCIKIDCWDGGEEGNDGPVVYHGHTLTSRVPFKEVIAVIKEYAFKITKYPLIVHLENHCSLDNQRCMASVLKLELGDLLYIPSYALDGTSGQSICEMSPEQIGSKIILKGKKLSDECDYLEGDVSEEDEGGETHAHKKKKCHERTKMKLCQELSNLIGIRRAHFVDFQTCRQQLAESFSLGESTAAKLAHACHEEFVHHNKHFLTRIFPNASRIDSSNYNPQDFWNCGCQMVALNFQTPGQMRDLFDGRFLQNGGCGYVLKPSIMRELVSIFPVTKGIIPGLTSQMLRLKIISGQNLPRPRGSTAKGDSIDPYIVVQIFGLPADCAEVQTKTISNEGNCPIFDESFEFQINLPELALVRLVVLDDEYIGDDFIGQYSIPFECIQTGYRHIRLLDSNGQRLGENCTLFVHVAISNKKGGGKHQKRFRKVHSDIRGVGIKAIDDILRSVSPSIIEAEIMRNVTEMAMNDLREELGLVETANIKQCLRILITRVATSSDNITINIVESTDKFPELQVVGQPSAHMNKAIAMFDRVLQELRNVVEHAGSQLEILTNAYSALLEMYDNLEAICSQAGLKGKKLTKTLDIYAWDMQILRGQIDLLESCNKNCRVSLEQMQSSTDSRLFGSFKSKDRSPVFARDRPRLALQEKGPYTDEMVSSLRSPTSPCEGQPRGILKNRSNSSNNLDPKLLTSTFQVVEHS
ncbi:Inactive phospholipase C-like protein 2 [Chamberlinius hualienensis]